jgi:hypothetical protein
MSSCPRGVVIGTNVVLRQVSLLGVLSTLLHSGDSPLQTPSSVDRQQQGSAGAAGHSNAARPFAHAFGASPRSTAARGSQHTRRRRGAPTANAAAAGGRAAALLWAPAPPTVHYRSRLTERAAPSLNPGPGQSSAICAAVPDHADLEGEAGRSGVLPAHGVAAAGGAQPQGGRVAGAPGQARALRSQASPRCARNRPIARLHCTWSGAAR